MGNPTRGVELAYELLEVDVIAAMPVNLLQVSGFLFMWVLASTLFDATAMLEKWGYEVVNHVNWVKTSKRGIYAPSNGCYLQHCKETCLVAMKGNGFDGFRPEYLEDLIVRWRNLRQSHKPDELYVMVEKAFPGGRYLELFARPHNLRRGWVSLGLEVPK
jgi:mRNA (2'-O-methyladenosine-N6-)-methyltransferase